jgi:hypothetical protein
MVFRRSEEAKTAFRESMQLRIDSIQTNVLELELQLLDSRNYFARRGINRNLRERKAQLQRYINRFDRYQKEGWI